LGSNNPALFRVLLFSLVFYTMLGCFNPKLGKIWTNPNVSLKCN